MSVWYAKNDIYKEARENGWVNPLEAYYINNKRFGYCMQFVNFLNMKHVKFKNILPPRGSFMVAKIEGINEGQELPGKKPTFNWWDLKVLCVSYELEWTDSNGRLKRIKDVDGHFPMLDSDVGSRSVYGGIPAKLQICRFYIDPMYLQFPLTKVNHMTDDQRTRVQDNTHVMRGYDIHYVLSKSVRKKILERDGEVCQICGVTGDDVKFQVDHIYPRSLGGDNRVENLQVLCDWCNRSKGGKTLWDYVFDYDIEVTPRIQAHIDRVRQIDFGRNKI